MTVTLDGLLESQIVFEVGDTKDVALLLSGGVDSHSVGFAASRLGYNVTAYSFKMKNVPSYDYDRAQETSKIMGWKFVGVELPDDKIEEDFFRLKRLFNCKKKTEFECFFPFLYVYPQIGEKHILTGLNADDHYGMSKRDAIHNVKDKAKFDASRIKKFQTETQYFFHRNLLSQTGQVFVSPYYTKEVLDFFLQFTHKELHSPVEKFHARMAYKAEFDKIGKIKRHLVYQKGSSIDKVFEEKLINNPKINFKNRKRMLDVYRDWKNISLTNNDDLFV